MPNAEIDKKAKKILQDAGVHPPSAQQYADACAQAEEHLRPHEKPAYDRPRLQVGAWGTLLHSNAKKILEEQRKDPENPSAEDYADALKQAEQQMAAEGVVPVYEENA